MVHQKLGRTGLDVSRLALGGLFVSSWGATFDQAKIAVHRAIELGINYIDTAPGYGDSEQVLGKALEGIDKPLILSTKLGGRPSPFEPKNPKHLRQSVEESLRLLKRDSIDILMIHEPDRPGQYNWWDDSATATGPVIEVLEDLKKSGVIRFTGLGGTTAYEIVPLMRTGKFDVVLTAFNYSLLWREAEHEILPTAKAMNMGVVIGSPLQQGALAARHDDVIDRDLIGITKIRRDQFKALYKLLDDAGMSIAEMAMRFIISNPDVSCVLTGARSAKEVELNHEAVSRGPLPPELIARINKIAAMVPFRPFEEPFGLPFKPGYRGPGPAR